MSEQTALSVEGDSMAGLPYPFSTASELIDIYVRTGLGIDEVVWANETAIRPAEQIDRHIETVFRTMRDCIHEGCTSRQAVLPGGLNVPRRAPAMYDRLAGSGDLLNQPAADGVQGSSRRTRPGLICSPWQSMSRTRREDASSPRRRTVRRE